MFDTPEHLDDEYSQLLAARLECCDNAIYMRLCGEIAANRALRLWCDDIHDPKRTASGPAADKDRDAITYMIKDREHGLGWDWQFSADRDKVYPGNLSFAWCGAFAAYAWSFAGLSRTFRSRSIASTYRLYEARHGRQVPLRIDWRAGDILVVGSRLACGDHITIATGPIEGKIIPTVEGNAVGHGPHGDRFEGVVRNQRAAGSVRFAYRPMVSDMER